MKYFYEMVKYEKIALNVHSYVTSFSVDAHNVLVLEPPVDYTSSRALRTKHHLLNRAQLLAIADQLANLHAFCARPNMSDVDTKKSVDDNYSIIRRMNESTFDRSLTNAVHYLQTHYSSMFVNLDKRIHQLYTSFDDVDYAYKTMSIDVQPIVLCHGHLTVDDVHFDDDDDDRLLLIGNWDVSDIVYVNRLRHSHACVLEYALWQLCRGFCLFTDYIDAERDARQ